MKMMYRISVALSLFLLSFFKSFSLKQEFIYTALKIFIEIISLTS